MPKRARGITAAFCSSVKEAGKYSDGDGLMLIVSGNGNKRWGQRLVVRGKRRDLGLGSFPLVSLAEARSKATENRRIAREGGDPLEKKRIANSIPTFADVADLTIKKKRVELSNAKHIQQWENTLRQYAFPKIGSKRVDAIGVEDILAVLEPIWETKTETASRLRGRIEAVLALATVRKWRSGPNPATWAGNLSMLMPKMSSVADVTHQPALQLAEAHEWWSDLSARQGMSAAALRFLTLTWARSGEVRGASWNEIELDKAIWRIPASRMKARQEHVVPLSQPAQELLASLPRLERSPYVFFAPRGGMLSDMSISAVMRRMHGTAEKRANERPEGNRETSRATYLDRSSFRPAVPHGLRSTARTWAAEKGYDREMAEIALAHRIGTEVERSYQRAELIERRRHMMEDWATFLAGASLFADILPFPQNTKRL